MRGVSSRMNDITRLDISRYRAKFPPVQIASGQSRLACADGMAECTP